MWALLFRAVLKKKFLCDGFTAGFFLFAIAGCLIIGYTVPFAGAIVRYRSVFLVFLLLPVLKVRVPGNYQVRQTNYNN